MLKRDFSPIWRVSDLGHVALYGFGIQTLNVRNWFALEKIFWLIGRYIVNGT